MKINNEFIWSLQSYFLRINGKYSKYKVFLIISFQA
jgi:hypothetical protein